METHKVYHNPAEFWEDVAPALRVDEAKNGLFLGLASMFRSHPNNCAYQSALFDGEKLLGALMVSRKISQAVLVPSPVAHPHHAKILIDQMTNTDIFFENLACVRETADIYQKLIEKTGCKINTLMDQGVYRCRKVIQPKSSDDILFRIANERDVPLIAKWLKDFNREATPHDPPQDFLKFSQDKIHKRELYVLEKDGSPVSMGSSGRDIGTSASVSLIYTPVKLRGQGYASAITAKLTQHLLDQGKRETYLFTDLANPTSNRIYQKIGYQFVCEFRYCQIFC